MEIMHSDARAVSPYSIRTVLSQQTGPHTGTYDSFVAVPDIAPLPGAHRMTHEGGRLSRSVFSKHWVGEPRRVTAFDGEEADAISNSVYDAFAGFLALNLPPSPSPAFDESSNRLAIEADGRVWAFDASTAPQEAWSVYRAAERMLELAVGTPAGLAS